MHNSKETAFIMYDALSHNDKSLGLFVFCSSILLFVWIRWSQHNTSIHVHLKTSLISLPLLLSFLFPIFILSVSENPLDGSKAVFRGIKREIENTHANLVALTIFFYALRILFRITTLHFIFDYKKLFLYYLHCNWFCSKFNSNRTQAIVEFYIASVHCTYKNIVISHIYLELPVDFFQTWRSINVTSKLHYYKFFKCQKLSGFVSKKCVVGCRMNCMKLLPLITSLTHFSFNHYSMVWRLTVWEWPHRCFQPLLVNLSKYHLA